MKANEIAALVIERASRFGGYNLQQFRQLCLRLGHVEQAEVAKGLLQVFTHGAAPPEGTAAQELAGRLLVALCPKADFNLRLVVHAALSRYELSVEQFPEYLLALFGEEQVLSVIAELEHEQLSQQERRALNTIRFWVRNARPLEGPNETAALAKPQ